MTEGVQRQRHTQAVSNCEDLESDSDMEWEGRNWQDAEFNHQCDCGISGFHEGHCKEIKNGEISPPHRTKELIETMSMPAAALKTPTSDPVSRFLHEIENALDLNSVHTAAFIFGAAIEDQIWCSSCEPPYTSVVKQLRVLRKTMVEMEEPGIWNTWIKELKSKLLQEKKNDCRELWLAMKTGGLGLISGTRRRIGSEEDIAFLECPES